MKKLDLRIEELKNYVIHQIEENRFDVVKAKDDSITIEIEDVVFNFCTNTTILGDEYFYLQPFDLHSTIDLPLIQDGSRAYEVLKSHLVEVDKEGIRKQIKELQKKLE